MRVAEAANQLGLHEFQLHGWCKTVKKKDLVAEVAKLRRQLVEQAKELDIVTSRKS